MKGESQRQRRTRVKKVAHAIGMYPPSHAMPKNVARAFRRHPPTTCTVCGVDLVWNIYAACYRVDGDPQRDCGRKYAHTPANGKRPYRFA